ncbi:MAG: hypothetical protein HY902_08040 [Deltaproteobacteria bacterium]|nr:hypothetical protein [Deltaproteobacteria bacterium]
MAGRAMRWMQWLLAALLAACGVPGQQNQFAAGGADQEAGSDAGDLGWDSTEAASDAADTAADQSESVDSAGGDQAAGGGDTLADAAVADTPQVDVPATDSASADSNLADVGAADAGPAAPAPPTLAQVDAALQSGDAAPLQKLLATYDMPVCEAGQCRFLVMAKGAQSVEIMGDWHDWATPDAATPVPGVPGLFTTKVAVDTSKTRQYKVKIDGQWAIDPSNPYFAFAGLGPNSAIYPANHSRLRWIGGVQSPQLNNVRNLYVYLPAAYFQNLAEYFPVLYWQDGFNVFTSPLAPFGDWKVDQISDEGMASGAVAPVIQVGVDTSDRMSEYVWAPLDDGTKVYPPKIAQYAAFLVDTVKPMIDKQFRTLPGRDHTAIGGSSLGGNASLWIAWQHWQVFGRLASFSGALWVGEGISFETGKPSEGPSMRAIIAENAAKVPKGALRVYLDSGDTDFDGTACYECDSWANTDWTRNALIAAGWDDRPEWDTDGNPATPLPNLPYSTKVAKVPALAWSAKPPAGKTWSDYLQLSHNLVCLVGHGHMHNEGAWNLRAPAALRFLFPGKNP